MPSLAVCRCLFRLMRRCFLGRWICLPVSERYRLVWKCHLFYYITYIQFCVHWRPHKYCASLESSNAYGKKPTGDITISWLYQGLRFYSEREDWTNPISIWPTKRNRSSNNDSLQKHQSESTFTGWRHRMLRHCSRGTTRVHASSIPLYHLCRLLA